MYIYILYRVYNMYHIYSYLVIHKNSGASRLCGFENSVNLLWHNVAHTHTLLRSQEVNTWKSKQLWNQNICGGRDDPSFAQQGLWQAAYFSIMQVLLFVAAAVVLLQCSWNGRWTAGSIAKGYSTHSSPPFRRRVLSFNKKHTNNKLMKV